MKQYRAYCFDLDGTVYKGTEVIEAAAQTIYELQKRGIEPYYITNNASVDREDVENKLAKMGIVAKRERIYTTAVASALYCAEYHASSHIYLYGEEGLRKAFAEQNLRVVGPEEADVAVVGINRESTYESLSEVMNVIRNGATFIATNSDKIIPTATGFGVGNGSFIRLLAHATGIEPLYIGKPESTMLELVRESGGYAKDEMVMIGDNYDTDILCGIQYEIDTIHVAGGVHTQAQIQQREKQPTYFVGNLTELL